MTPQQLIEEVTNRHMDEALVVDMDAVLLDLATRLQNHGPIFPGCILTVRDVFAIVALATTPHDVRRFWDGSEIGNLGHHEAAVTAAAAYAIADAMLTECGK